ncbi:Glycerol-3-phosphate dehydrogenase 2 [Nostocoides japonicum T1-X7]|uniref:Glycerol-3-phosphate dehydrogenase n=1 Tax=Nostocoides japonicum T1-X7 TaxID=1194083 RepID=A0A077M306_9MICO|nr:glycerol-3-phosphate dehydrogenase/oxidase [Tetrasphaera japonica]CCH79462.1 Glycerol-3-phosphate dehydrogenase 2 [Tetrasphaera japonica T1-X7]
MTLSPANRRAGLARLRSGMQLDVLVVGGGVVGCGAALDAVTRGLSTGLIEARDFASGTSSRSSKLIHGGLRYLEMLDFGLVHEALQERGLLLRTIAPHLVRPVSFMYPLTKPAWERFYVGSGIALYDGLAFGVGQSGGLPHHRHLTKKKALAIMPSLKPTALTGAVQYFDAQVDDARYVLELARTATRFGATVVNRVAALDLLRDGDTVVGVRARDGETGEDLEIRAREVVGAAGVWTGELEAMLGTEPSLKVRASKGIHLVVPRDRIDSSSGVILRTAKSVLFIIPWDEHWIIGTTDTDWTLDKVHPAATSADIDYLLDTVNAVLVTPLTRDDIDGVYAGLRPLISGEESSTTKLSREHVVSRVAPGMVVVAGGKYTTYRVMAKDAVDLAVKGLGQDVAECRTQDVPLAGARGFEGMAARPELLADSCGIDTDAMVRLLDRYGSLVVELIALMNVDPSLREELPGSEGHLKVEFVYAAAQEAALHLTDVLTRRTRVSIEARDRGIEAAPHAAALIAPILGWDAAKVAEEISIYHRRVEAEMSSQTMPDDVSADEARRRAPDAAL